MLARLARLCLIVAVLAATQGMLVHPLVHVGEAVHAHDDAHPDEPSPVAHHGCDLCVAFGALVAQVGEGPAAVDAPRGVAVLAIAPGTTHLPRAPPAFRSQAPPSYS